MLSGLLNGFAPCKAIPDNAVFTFTTQASIYIHYSLLQAMLHILDVFCRKYGLKEK